jgi:hypothetical protein
MLAIVEANDVLRLREPARPVRRAETVERAEMHFQWHSSLYPPLIVMRIEA